jgi:hypothetical protein
MVGPTGEAELKIDSRQPSLRAIPSKLLSCLSLVKRVISDTVSDQNNQDKSHPSNKGQLNPNHRMVNYQCLQRELFKTRGEIVRMKMKSHQA